VFSAGKHVFAQRREEGGGLRSEPADEEPINSRSSVLGQEIYLVRPRQFFKLLRINPPVLTPSRAALETNASPARGRKEGEESSKGKERNFAFRPTIEAPRAVEARRKKTFCKSNLIAKT
jgi:hypothetical protein